MCFILNLAPIPPDYRRGGSGGNEIIGSLHKLNLHKFINYQQVKTILTLVSYPNINQLNIINYK
jgi:hypothetical protein